MFEKGSLDAVIGRWIVGGLIVAVAVLLGVTWAIGRFG